MANPDEGLEDSAY